MEYENRVILFIDVLGFRNLVDSSIEKTEDIQRIINLITILRQDLCIDCSDNEIQKICKEKYFNKSVISQFSDSFVISKTFDKDDDFLDLLLDIYNIIYTGYYHDFVFRGSVSIGNMIHTDKYMFGPGFNTAYDLEKKAKYPIVLFDESFLNIIEKDNTKINKYFVKDEKEKIVYLDLFEGLSLRFNTIESIKLICTNIKNVIEKGISHNDPCVKEKYTWLLNQILYNSKENKKYF